LAAIDICTGFKTSNLRANGALQVGKNHKEGKAIALKLHGG
jgi:hypothetical protein